MFEMSIAFVKMKIICSLDSKQNSSVADKKRSSGFYFASGHSALWWFKHNAKVSIVDSIRFFL